jgi:alpha-beta hydrolase superfamily lysophospholipase
LNQNVQRFSADAAALNLIAAQYETSGLLAIPLVTMHTNADPIVPAQQGDLYLAKTKASGSTQFHEHIVVNTFGHCAFGLNDVQNAFNRVNALVANPPKRNVYLPLINSQ